MTRLTRVLTRWTCPFCGGDLYVETEELQHPATSRATRYTFWAREDDDVICECCGFRGVVTVDGGGDDDDDVFEAHLSYDEMSETNGAAWERANLTARAPLCKSKSNVAT